MANFLRIRLNGGYEDKINLDKVLRVFFSKEEKFIEIAFDNDFRIKYIEGSDPGSIPDIKSLYQRFPS